MQQLIIGLFLTVLAQFIKNPVHAQQYRAELEHIRNGIDAVLGPEQPPITGVAS